MGISLSFGCDVPATPILEPKWAFTGALTRTTFNRNIYHPSQALSMKEALRAHTMGSAYASFEEKLKGSIEKGKMADMVVWSHDLYSLNPRRDLRNLEAKITIVGGKIVSS
jgi:predicted amidohydrolase YtcJ